MFSVVDATLAVENWSEFELDAVDLLLDPSAQSISDDFVHP